MTATTNRPAVIDLVEGFLSAPRESWDADLARLRDAVWGTPDATGPAAVAAAELVRRLPGTDGDRRGAVLVLLGLLVEAEGADGGPVRAAVRAGIEDYLALLDGPAAGEPAGLAALYLLSHLIEDRLRILAAVAGLDLPPDDLTRLERCLEDLDPRDAVLGRVWPSPWEWSLDDAQRDFDREWIRALAPEQLRSAWDADTRMVRAYIGAKAHWAVRNGRPATVPDPTPPADPAATAPAEVDLEVFARHAGSLRCPTCREPLELGATGARCTGCSTAYAFTRGVLDLSAGVADTPDDEDVLQNAATMPSIGAYYESVLRPAFLRVMGSNWGLQITPADEDRYLAERTRPVDGPVLDLAAGAGRWTSVLAGALGPRRVVAIDLLTPMLATLRGVLPEVAPVRASALALPFSDASLGGVNCWNALQALPDAAAAIAEIGRCLRPGGTLTLLTFRPGTDPAYRHFQLSHSFPGHPEGIPLFEFDELRGWLAEAGMTVRDESGPGTFAILTAVRDAGPTG